LFISTNTQLLNPTQQSLDGYVDIKDLFEEVHILILRTGIPSKYPVLRVSSNVWLYTASSKYWWLAPFEGLKMAEEQLAFAAGFRPDLIVARDPFESSLVAIKFDSIRTATHNLKRLIGSKRNIADLKTLPRLQNYEALIKAAPQINVRDKYRQFSIIMLYAGELTYDSALWQVIDAASFALKNERVGLIIIGSGPAKNEFEKRVEQQVVFLSKVEDFTSYLKAATILIVPDTGPRSEELVLKGAAAGTPLVVTATEQRSDIFTDGESAFICEPENIQEMTDRINDLLNNPELRETFIKNAQSLIKTEFHQDKKMYQEEYRLSIEQALFVGTEGALEE
jgi:glycosyltransferase involved in cell wall biosynthesis